MLDQEKFKLFVLKDDKSNSYGAPITYPTRGMFIRDFLQDALSKGQAVFARHPQDFSVFEVGEFDPRSGQIFLHENKSCLGLVQDFRSSLSGQQ